MGESVGASLRMVAADDPDDPELAAPAGELAVADGAGRSSAQPRVIPPAGPCCLTSLITAHFPRHHASPGPLVTDDVTADTNGYPGAAAWPLHRAAEYLL